MDRLCQHRTAASRAGNLVVGADTERAPRPGFAWTPIGTNARDFELFEALFGYAPQEILTAATKLGGELMLKGDELGQVRPGYLADLILVDGDPLSDVKLFQDHDRILMIMKDGHFHKKPKSGGERAVRIAA